MNTGAELGSVAVALGNVSSPPKSSVIHHTAVKKPAALNARTRLGLTRSKTAKIAGTAIIAALWTKGAFDANPDMTCAGKATRPFGSVDVSANIDWTPPADQKFGSNWRAAPRRRNPPTTYGNLLTVNLLG